MKEYHYKATITWTGNKGTGTSTYRAYGRDYELSIESKHTILMSSDPSFLGDETRYNPEELFLASLSSCHMLWYLHLCSEAGIIVLEYTDHATASMVETSSGGGHFTEVTLYPKIVVSDVAMVDIANLLHQEANKYCFIANSCNFPVLHNPICSVADNS